MTASTGLARRVILVGIVAQAVNGFVYGEPLHSLINQHLKPVAGIEPARCSDAEFLRRASLDLIGMPPTAKEAREFLQDSTPDKRARLIDRLFASPHHARHLAATLDIMLMERRSYTHVSADEWQGWLLKSVRENKPWNILAREILQADGEDPAQRAPVRFALDRGSEPNLITRDLGRIFFGRDMQCAQCHDHPIVADYLQSDYQGLLAFVAPTYQLVKKEGDKQITLQAERAGTDITFESVFVKTPRRTGPRVPDGTTLDEPFFMPGEEYEVAPAENVKPVPKFSRRAKLAELATNGSNKAFNENIVNRLWAHMFGRGLVHPLDLHHPGNPATDPQLLELLSKQFVEMNFDIRAFLRELALTEVYQRSFDAPQDLVAVSAKALAELNMLEKERVALEEAAKKSSEAYSQALQAWEEAEAAMLPVAGELDTARTQYAEAKKKMEEALSAAAAATAQLQAKQAAAGPLQQAASAAQQAAQVLPEDKELAGAAQVFATKSQQVATEAEALEKTVAETNAAVQPVTEAWNSTKPVVEGALTKVMPLTAAMKQAEQTMLTARKQSESAAETLAAFDRRLATVKQIASLPELQAAIAQAQSAVPAREAELVVAQKSLEEYAPQIQPRELEVAAATKTLAAATASLDAARAENAKREELAKSIRAALDATNAAREQAPDDMALASAAAAIEPRATAAETEKIQSQRQLDTAVAKHQTANEALFAAQRSLVDAMAERLRREQAVAEANAAIALAKATISAKQSEFDRTISEVNDRWESDFTVAALKPLTPEQLCWTVFRVTEVYDRYWQAEVAELDKSSPMTEEQRQDPTQFSAREAELETRTFNKLKEHINTFITFYGAAAGQPQGDFFSTADQALFAANGGPINSWVAPAEGNVTDRVVKQTDPRVAAEELYLSVLTRLPTDEEAAEVAQYLAARGDDKPAAAQELVWSLLNLAEFRFNH